MVQGLRFVGRKGIECMGVPWGLHSPIPNKAPASQVFKLFSLEFRDLCRKRNLNMATWTRMASADSNPQP